METYQLDQTKKYKAGHTYLQYFTAENNPLVNKDGWIVELQVDMIGDRGACMLYDLDEFLKRAILENLEENLDEE